MRRTRKMQIQMQLRDHKVKMILYPLRTLVRRTITIRPTSIRKTRRRGKWIRRRKPIRRMKLKRKKNPKRRKRSNMWI